MCKYVKYAAHMKGQILFHAATFAAFHLTKSNFTWVRPYFTSSNLCAYDILNRTLGQPSTSDDEKFFLVSTLVDGLADDFEVVI